MNDKYCPHCKEPMEGPIMIERIPGTIGDEVVYSSNTHYHCMTCPDVFEVVVSGPFEEPTRPKDGPTNTYIIYMSDYLFDPPSVEEFKGTWRELLYKLHGVSNDNEDDEIDEFEGRSRSYATYPTELLKTDFEEWNGDGCPYYLVWCVEEHKQVIK